MKRVSVYRLVVFGCVSSWAAGSAAGATAVLRAVRVNDTPIAPTDHVTIQPGDLVVTEAYISGWNENEPGGRLRVFQLSIDPLGSYWSGESGSLFLAGLDLPGGVVPCGDDDDCAPETNWCKLGGCLLSCASDADCTEPFPRCRLGSNFCVGEGHDPEAFSFVDESHPNFVFAGQQPICAVRTAALDPAGGCVTLALGSAVLDDGNERYAVTFAFEASDDACGRFTVRFEDVPEGSSVPRSFIQLVSGFGYRFDNLVPLYVNVFCPFPIGACCLPRSLCEDLPRGGCDRKGGAWKPDYACGDKDLTCPRVVVGPKGSTAR